MVPQPGRFRCHPPCIGRSFGERGKRRVHMSMHLNEHPPLEEMCIRDRVTIKSGGHIFREGQMYVHDEECSSLPNSGDR